MTVLQRTTELAPNSAVVYQYLGQILGNQGRFDAAIAAFEEAIELDPSYAAAYYNLGFVLNAVDRTEEGKAAIQKALLLTREQAER
ncbi:tetratricopeptide repeat protein [Microcoleus sp. MOSTC5]|uniref:tetratricopeptide repeat protein n=1 Tax=Microcoleus sp. MOSTC5 TaxID=3055378 RepID=UPI004040AB73